MSGVFRRASATTDVDQAQQWMSELYGSPMRLDADRPEDFQYRMASVGDDAFSVSRLVYSGSCRSGAASFLGLVVAHAVQGEHRWRVGPERGIGSVPFVIAPGREMEVEFRGLDLLTVAVTVPALEAAIRALTGRDEARIDLERPNADLRNPAFLMSTMRFLDQALRADPVAFAEPLIRAEALRQSVAAVVATHRLVDAAVDRDAQVGGRSRSVRRALAYIDEHAHLPITVDDVASACHMSVRGLQAAFHRETDTTPTDSLRRVRLEGARADLLRAEGGTRVETVARRWGFANPTRFAARYRAAFGETPSATLRR